MAAEFRADRTGGASDKHGFVFEAIADLILVQGQVGATVTRLVQELKPDVVGLSVMTNYAAGIVPGAIGHDQTINVATAAAGSVRRLLRAFLEGYD